MITKEKFFEIDSEIKNCIHDTLKNLKSKSKHDYVLLLSQGEYRPEILLNPSLNLSPFVIDYHIDKYRDYNRLTFLADFLNTFYTYAEDLEIEKKEQLLHIEMMIYTHIWESKPFLKQLYRLAKLSLGESYTWEVKIPEMGKHNFIRNDIRKSFEDCSNTMSQIIKKGFHTSLRNAFAHSEYCFEEVGGSTTIFLDNYKGENWELREITLQDWSVRFAYSALLSFHLMNAINTHRKELSKVFNTKIFTIKHPSKDGTTLRNVNIEYNENQDIFRFCRQ